MNLQKSNIKWIILIIILVIISSGISVFATYNYFASDIKYTDDKSVADALNDLYLKSNSTDILKIGVYNTLNSQNIDIKSKLPDDYKNLTINNFIILNAQKVYSRGNNEDRNNSVLDSYDSENGILKINASRHRDGTFDHYIDFTLACILGNINIQDL